MTELLCGEMAETAVIRLAVFTVYLEICAVQDFTKRRISIPFSALTGTAVLLLDIPLFMAGVTDMLFWGTAFLPGILLLFLSFAASGSAGTGDGICFLVLGGLLGPGIAGMLVMASLLLASLAGIILLACRKVKRDTHLPFLFFAGLVWTGGLLVYFSPVDW